MALTQNFLSSANFNMVWRSFRYERKRLACKLLEKLKEKKPIFYEEATKMNKDDDFIMYDQRKNGQKRKPVQELNEFEKIGKKRKLSLSSDTQSSSSSSSDSSDSDSSDSE